LQKLVVNNDSPTYLKHLAACVLSFEHLEINSTFEHPTDRTIPLLNHLAAKSDDLRTFKTCTPYSHGETKHPKNAEYYKKFVVPLLNKSRLLTDLRLNLPITKNSMMLLNVFNNVTSVDLVYSDAGPFPDRTIVSDAGYSVMTDAFYSGCVFFEKFPNVTDLTLITMIPNCSQFFWNDAPGDKVAHLKRIESNQPVWVPLSNMPELLQFKSRIDFVNIEHLVSHLCDEELSQLFAFSVELDIYDPFYYHPNDPKPDPFYENPADTATSRLMRLVEVLPVNLKALRVWIHGDYGKYDTFNDMRIFRALANRLPYLVALVLRGCRLDARKGGEVTKMFPQLKVAVCYNEPVGNNMGGSKSWKWVEKASADRSAVQVVKNDEKMRFIWDTADGKYF
jgi:hypothetical protein